MLLILQLITCISLTIKICLRYRTYTHNLKFDGLMRTIFTDIDSSWFWWSLYTGLPALVVGIIGCIGGEVYFYDDMMRVTQVHLLVQEVVFFT